MKKFLDIFKEESEKSNPVVMAFGRMNPPTIGHEKVVDKVKDEADKLGAKHVIALSHSQDSKKNPLTPEQKVKHVKRFFPNTNVESATTEHPTILHQAAKLHAKGHDELHVVAGSDRVDEYKNLLNKYNGVKSNHGYYNFKKINVISAGHRDPDSEGAEGMSASKMREHAKNNNFDEFRKGVPQHVSNEHAKELFTHVRAGMNLHENINLNTFLSFVKESKNNQGLFKAVFLVGGPGSGKDYIMRETLIKNNNVHEMNMDKLHELLLDKQKFIDECANNIALKQRNSIVINGNAYDTDKICYLKEELEELGYECMLLLVNTTNEISALRSNRNTNKSMNEEIRFSKWKLTQENSKILEQVFGEMFVSYDNSLHYGLLDESKKSTVKDLKLLLNIFFKSPIKNESALFWLKRNNINELFDRSTEWPIPSVDVLMKKKVKNEQPAGAGGHTHPIDANIHKLQQLRKRANNPKEKKRITASIESEKSSKQSTSRSSSTDTPQKKKPLYLYKLTNPKLGEEHDFENSKMDEKSISSEHTTNTNFEQQYFCEHTTFNEGCPICVFQADKWKSDNIQYNEKTNTKNRKTEKTTHGTSNTSDSGEKIESALQIITKPKPKKPEFQKDAEQNRIKKTKNFQIKGNLTPNVRATGIGKEYDTRGQGTVFPMGGLQDPAFRMGIGENLDEPTIPVTGYGGGTNKEPMVEPGMTYGKPLLGPKNNKTKKKNTNMTEEKNPESIAKKHKVSIDQINKELKIGTKIEHEHTKDDHRARKIALDHLDEFPDYYTRLVKMEKQAKKSMKENKMMTFSHFSKKLDESVEYSDDPAYLKEEVRSLLEFVSDDEINFHGDEEQFIDSVDWELNEEPIEEALYKGKKVTLGKPMKGDVKKSKVFVKGPKGNVVKVNFGDKNMKIKKHIPSRRRSFRARHRCDTPGPRWKARYWSCKAW